MALTAKNKLFVEEYVANGYNATQAYLTVYECNYNTANTKACNVLAKPEVKEYMKEVQKERTERLNINADRVLEELNKIAFAPKDDQDIAVPAKLKAIELIQKQIGVAQTARIEANVNQQVVIVDDIDQIK